ncbi:hypothetical protein MHY1_02969 [Methylovirgula sp. HY1]|nr:hypothetical protein MHY1_02969 [Methylovirgula sp. HY1]
MRNGRIPFKLDTTDLLAANQVSWSSYPATLAAMTIGRGPPLTRLIGSELEN